MHKYLLLGSTALGALIVAALPATAAHFNGWYLGLEGGVNFLDDTTFALDQVGVGTSPDAAANADFDTGWAALGTLGYAWNNWRVELELGFRSNDVDNLSPFFDNVFVDFDPTDAVNAVDLQEFSQMVNVIYDWRFGERWALSLGAGIGGDLVDLEDDGNFVAPVFTVVDDDYVFAWQLIAGLNYALNSRTDLFLNYRFFNAQEPEFEGFDRSGDPITIRLDDLEKHTVTIGVRFDLAPDSERVVAAPPPPPLPPEPAAPPAPPPPQEFVIAFAANKANLTAEAQQTVAAAADQARQTGSATIRIDGEGSAAIGRRRAIAVRNALVAQGIPAASIDARPGMVEVRMK